MDEFYAYGPVMTNHLPNTTSDHYVMIKTVKPVIKIQVYYIGLKSHLGNSMSFQHKKY